MSDKWYYVLSGERKGPVAAEKIQILLEAGTITNKDFVWKKGFENWIKLEETGEFSVGKEEDSTLPPILDSTPLEFELSSIDDSEKILFIKIGADRLGQVVEYGPFSLSTLKKLYKENRVNGKTFVYCKGMSDWMLLGDVKDFENIFEEVPPEIEEADRRSSTRKPFIARIFVQNKQNVFEGICRDVSIGGMQVLVDNFPGRKSERISINVHPENSDHHFVAAGEIVRVFDRGQGFSFRFIDLPDNSIEAIKSYLNE